MAMAVLPVPGVPARRMARPAIFPANTRRVTSVPSALRKSAETPESGVSSQKAAQTLRILIKIIKNSDICELFNILM